MGPGRSQQAWNADTLQRLERPYLEAADPRGACGFRGDGRRWRRARAVIVDALHTGGTFLDVGCAGGLLLASVRAWAAERGLDIEPYGLELSEALAARARRDHPRWAKGIFVGDVTTWAPPRRFAFVRIELVYAPPPARRALVAHCLDTLLAPGGRLVVCSYAGDRHGPPPDDVAAQLAGWGFAVQGQAVATGRGGRPLTRVAWVEAPGVGDRT